MNRNIFFISVIGILLCVVAAQWHQRRKVNRLIYKIDHVLDIANELHEISQNLAIKDAVDSLLKQSPRSVPECDCCSDIMFLSDVLHCKSKQIVDILHPVLCDLKR